MDELFSTSCTIEAMHRLIIPVVFGFYSALAQSSVDVVEHASRQLLAVPQMDVLADSPATTAIDPFTRLNFPLSDAFEIRRRIWDKVSRCEVCHSLELGFANSYIPVLQGQNREYLYSKIRMFKETPLSRHPFPEFSRALTQDEMIDISLYYNIQNSLLDLRLVMLDSNRRNATDVSGVSIEKCLDCHARDGNGAGLIPDLSGQSRNYLSYRIREIASDSSKIHIKSDAPVSCDITKVSIGQSRLLANRLSLVVDSSRLSRGAEVYSHYCQSCHDSGDAGAPVLSSQFDWVDKLQAGINQYADYTSKYKHRGMDEFKHQLLSRNQWTDAMHYAVSQSELDDR